jgi:hypothetical protein
MPQACGSSMSGVIEEKRHIVPKSDDNDGGGRSVRNRLLLAVWAVVLAAIVAVLCAKIEDTYLKHRPFFYDPLSYLYENCVLHERVLHEGRWAVIASELRDGWAPLRTVPLLLFAPKALEMKDAHLFTAAPALALFLLLLGWMVERGSGSLALSAGAMVFCCAVAGFYHPHFGMGAYWLDLTGGFLMGAAACCLGLSEGARKIPWLVAFGVIAALAVWARQATGVYLFIACGPILGAAIVTRARRSPNRWQDILWPSAAVGIPVCLLAGPFFWTRFSPLYSYYVEASYGYQSVWDSLAFTYQVFLQRVTWQYLLVCFLVMAAGLGSRWWRGACLPFAAVLGSLWLANATLLFLGLSCQIGGAEHAVFPGVLLIVVGCFWAWGPASGIPHESAARTLSCKGFKIRAACLPLATGAGLFVVSAIFSADGIRAGFSSAASYRENDRMQKAFFDTLSDQISKLPRNYIFGVYFEEAGALLYVNGFFRNAVPKIDRTFYFVVHESYWKASYPGLDAAEIAALGVKQMESNVDVALVFSDPRFASVEWPVAYGSYFNLYSRLVAEQLALTVVDQTRWRKLFEIETPLYGGVGAYLNLRRQGAALPAGGRQ